MNHLDALRDTWRDRERTVLLLIGIDGGAALLAVWRTWQDDPRRCTRLDVIAIDPDSCPAEDLLRATTGAARQRQAEALARRWPPMTRNLHRLDLDGGRMTVLLARGPVLDWLPGLQAEVNAFMIRTPDVGTDAQQGIQRLGKALARLAAPQASLWSATATAPMRHALTSAGFDFTPGAAGLAAVYSPRFAARAPVAAAAPAAERHALIVGAGLAGCATACALAEQGWSSTLIDRREAPAMEASGNPGGLYHGSVNAQDGVHARFNRAAALQAQRAVQRAIDAHGARGGTHGLLRLETRLPGVAAMHSVIDAQRLPPAYVQALDAAEAGARCGLPVKHAAWFYPGGGWVQPAALAHSFLQRAGASARFRGGLAVHRVQRCDDGWQLLDDAGCVIDRAGTVVLASAVDALRLLRAAHWPVQTVRGQISLFDNRTASALPRLPLPRLPLAGAGYLLPEIDGMAVFGASAQPGDTDAAVREADHAFNLARLEALCAPRVPAPHELQGRVGWRCVAADRLPLIGAVPDERDLAGWRIERHRDVPRQAGLYVFTALGSRGIGWSALGAQLLAAIISGAPLPLESSLVRAVDPARFVLRHARRAAR